MEDKNTLAMISLLKELYKSECKKSMRYLITIYILIACLLVSVVFGIVMGYELSTYDTVTITETTTTETYENSVDGEGANIVNGNQYNDSATHNEQ